MTKEDWARIEKAVSGLYGYAKLLVDGRPVTFNRERVSENQLGIVTYIDGQWKGEWFTDKKECPEQRYLRPYFKYCFSAKERARQKKLPKWLKKDLNINPDLGVNLFSPNWNNVTEIRRHYEKTFASIELIEVVG